MALSDRFYMREDEHSPWVVYRLIIILLVAFVLQSALQFYGDIQVHRELALSMDGLKRGKIWQLLTFQFLHSTPWPWHVLFNCLGLYFFGRRVEEMLGPRKFLTVYLLAGVIGGLFQALLSLLPRHADFPVVGASAGVCGIIALFCTRHPMQELQAWIYFFPITIRAYWLLIFLTCYSAYGALIPHSNVADGAHLGGILFGIAYVRGGEDLWEKLIARVRWTRRKPTSYQQPRRSAKHSPWKNKKTESEVFISKQVDPILDKISAQGIDSLTDEEKKILEAARKLMS